MAAKKIGISFPTLRSALLGVRVPNARCVSKFAKFLGISAAAVVKAAGPKGARRGVSKAAAKGARRGRPPGSAAAIGRPSKANAAIIKKLGKVLAKATAVLATMSQEASGEAAQPRVVRPLTKTKAHVIRRTVKKVKKAVGKKAAQAAAPVLAPAPVPVVRRRAAKKKRATVTPVVKAHAAQKAVVVEPKPKRAKPVSKKKVIPPPPTAVVQPEAEAQPVQAAT